MRNITPEEVAFLMQHHDEYTKFRRGHVVQFSDEVLDVVEKISKEVYNIPMSRSCGSCVADAMRNVFNLAREESEKQAKEAKVESEEIPVYELTPTNEDSIDIVPVYEAVVEDGEPNTVLEFTIPQVELKENETVNVAFEVEIEAAKEPISDIKTEEPTTNKATRKRTPKKG